jgi:hypothetical protein
MVAAGESLLEAGLLASEESPVGELLALLAARRLITVRCPE